MSAFIQKSPSSAEDRSTAVCAVLVIDSGSYQAFEDKHALAHVEAYCVRSLVYMSQLIVLLAQKIMT